MRPLFPYPLARTLRRYNFDRYLTSHRTKSLIQNSNDVALHVTLCHRLCRLWRTVDVCTTRTRLLIVWPKPIATTLSTPWCVFSLRNAREEGNTLQQASRLFAAMLDDIVVDVALQSHQEVARSKRKCDICNTQCVFPNGFAHGSDTADVDVRSCGQGACS